LYHSTSNIILYCLGLGGPFLVMVSLNNVMDFCCVLLSKG
jgi:hypothetical protein